jgi:hypothetical protein
MTLSKIMEGLAALLVLAFIGVWGVESIRERVNPTVQAPHRSDAQTWAAAKMTVYPVGEPMRVNGCKVTVHRVAVSSGLNDFTMATAECDTAKVTATEQSCGKNCNTASVKIDQTVNTAQASPVVVQ